MMESTLFALTIAGSDSCAGAGIQADLKTFSALGVYGCTAITAITAQNTCGVQKVEGISLAMVAAQIDAVMEDIPIQAVKTGMLGTPELIERVAERIRRWKIKNYVLDPVMVAKSGDSLLSPEACEAVKTHLFPLARVATPNRFEAEKLSGITIDSREQAEKAAERLLALGAETVVLKGCGFEPGQKAVDLVQSQSGEPVLYRAEKIQTDNLHGTGCTFSAAITVSLAKGRPAPSAIREAKLYMTEALRQSESIGKGRGPVNHFWNFER